MRLLRHPLRADASPEGIAIRSVDGRPALKQRSFVVSCYINRGPHQRSADALTPHRRRYSHHQVRDVLIACAVPDKQTGVPCDFIICGPRQPLVYFVRWRPAVHVGQEVLERLVRVVWPQLTPYPSLEAEYTTQLGLGCAQRVERLQLDAWDCTHHALAPHLK